MVLPECPLRETFLSRNASGLAHPKCQQPRQLGGNKSYHDGGGLCSPGRWTHATRNYVEARQRSAPLSFFTDAKAENGHAWIGGFLELVDWCQGFWFSLEVKPEWAPWDLGLGPSLKVTLGP